MADGDQSQTTAGGALVVQTFTLEPGDTLDLGFGGEAARVRVPMRKPEPRLNWRLVLVLFALAAAWAGVVWLCRHFGAS